jgi:hypothetical protein
MAQNNTMPVHTFHIPVMGTGFTIDTPLKVARYGISSVISLVDDKLISQMHKQLGGADESVADRAEDSRARRITAYLNLLDDGVRTQMERLRSSLFEAGSEITRYFEMLPDSPLKTLYQRMLDARDLVEKADLQAELRRRVVPGAIDVNIMTKLDRDRFRDGQMLPPQFSDAMSALRGYAQSKVRSSLILSAGMNQKLFAYLAEFPDFFPDDVGELKKKIVLKVSDFRSALVQGKLLARRGLWVSEYRVESGLNCGGHAFGGKGQLLGPVLEEFRDKRDDLVAQLHEACHGALEKVGRPAPDEPLPVRVTVQGGIGTAEENDMLREFYHVDGTGWGSPFLFVPDVVSIDQSHVDKLCDADEDDVYLSNSSPLGVPFWSLRTSDSENARRLRIESGCPGSQCPKGYLVANTEFTKKPICTASRAYQRLKLQALERDGRTPDEQAIDQESILAKACICHDLAGGATVTRGLDDAAETAVCVGPNGVYFSRMAQLREMIDHIYGRARLPLDGSRPHMFIKELSLHVDRLREEAGRCRRDMVDAAKSSFESKANLLAGINSYREKAAQLAADRRDEFLEKLDTMRADIERILPGGE